MLMQELPNVCRVSPHAAAVVFRSGRIGHLLRDIDPWMQKKTRTPHNENVMHVTQKKVITSSTAPHVWAPQPGSQGFVFELIQSLPRNITLMTSGGVCFHERLITDTEDPACQFLILRDAATTDAERRRRWNSQ
jgi:hypothetical protein